MATVLRRLVARSFPARLLSFAGLSCGGRGRFARPSTVSASSSSSSSSSSTMTVDLDNNSGIAVMKLHRAPVNSLDLDFLTEFTISLEKLEMNKGCRGVVLTSTLPKVFSAGLDIMEMYGTSAERCAEFWKAVQEMWIKLYSCRLVTIAAINGSCIAGGCVISLASDYRIMADNPRYAIGLNETKLGIVAPFWLKDTLENTVGHRRTEMALQLGLLYSAPEALKIGMVDELVPEEKVMISAMEAMAKWFNVPDHARQITKSMMRKATVDKLLSCRDSDVDNFVSFVTKDSIQKSLKLYLENLRKKKD